MVIGPRVPDEIARKRREKVGANNQDNKSFKIKQLFDPTKSVNDELKKEIQKHTKHVSDRFEQ